MQYKESTITALLLADDRQAWRYRIYKHEHKLRMEYNDIDFARIYLN